MSWLDALGQDEPALDAGKSCDWFNTKDVLSRVIAGERTNDIADALGVSKDTLIHYLAKRVPGEWKDAQVLRALRHRQEARRALADARLTGFRRAERNLARALWQLQQVCLRAYGNPKPPEDIVRRFKDPAS